MLTFQFKYTLCADKSGQITKDDAAMTEHTIYTIQCESIGNRNMQAA